MKKFCTVCREEKDMDEREERYAGQVRERTVDIAGIPDGAPVITCDFHTFEEWKAAQVDYRIDTI